MQYSRERQADRILIVKYYLQVLFVANTSLVAIDRKSNFNKAECKPFIYSNLWAHLPSSLYSYRTVTYHLLYQTPTCVIEHLILYKTARRFNSINNFIKSVWGN